MDLLDKQIIKALKEKRKELLAEIETVNRTLKLFEAPPEVREPREVLTQNQKLAVWNALHGEKTAEQLRRATGLSLFITKRRLTLLIEEGRVETVEHCGVIHYMRVKRRARVRAGYGVVAGSA